MIRSHAEPRAQVHEDGRLGRGRVVKRVEQLPQTLAEDGLEFREVVV